MDMKKNRKLETKQTLFLVLGIFLISMFIIGGTYAYMTLSISITNNTIAYETSCFDIVYDADNDSTPISGTLIPSSGPGGGLNGKISMGLASKCKNIDGYGSFYLDVTSGSEVLFRTVDEHCENSQTLRTLTKYTDKASCEEQTNGVWVTGGTALKYAVYTTNNISSTTIPNKVGYLTDEGSLGLYENFPIVNQTVDYHIYVWLDGNLIDNSYVSQSFVGSISASASQVLMNELDEGGSNDTETNNNEVIIHYNVSGGTITSETTSVNNNTFSWTTDEDGTVMRNDVLHKTVIVFDETTDENGLDNYNNSKYVEIKKLGNTAVSGEEWICLSGCTTENKTFDQTEIYSSDDFCDASEGDCVVELGVNWRTTKVIINYNVNGGSIKSSTTTESGNTYSWSVDDAGNVLRNGVLHKLTISYGGTTSESGLDNYNNSNYVKISHSKTGVPAVSDAEWKCKSGCTTTNKTFDQTEVYDASDFCDASYGDCTVVVSVNWSSYSCYKVIIDIGLNCRESTSSTSTVKAAIPINYYITTIKKNGYYYHVAAYTNPSSSSGNTVDCWVNTSTGLSSASTSYCK